MTTLVVKLSPDLAKRLATAADILGLSHAAVGEQAVRLLCRSVVPLTRTGSKKQRRSKARATN